MSKIARYTGNLRAFGSNAQGLERTLFGETAQADDLTSQVTTSFLRGWGVVGPSENPSLEDFNAAMYTMSQFIAYQHQMGIPEWDALQEYYIGSLCVRAGETYSSLADGNIGSPPPSVKWTPVLTAKNGIANLGLSDVAHLPQLTGVVGTSRNAIMSITAVSSTATFTADELIVQTALGGRQYKLSSFSKVINLSATGAGGMDTGTVPAAGFVALYAIYNPTTLTSALLAVNATSVVAPEVYGGANMPAGYTASALVSVWPTQGGGQFSVGFLTGRNLSFVNVLLVNSSTAPTVATALSLATAVPLNARVVTAAGRIQAISGTGQIGFVVAADSQLIGRASGGAYTATSVAIDQPPFTINLITKQQCYYYVSVTGVTSYSFSLSVSGYSI